MASQAVQKLQKQDVLDAARTFRPGRKLQKWIVIINGQEFSARSLLLYAARVAPNDSTNSIQAVAKLQELGFEIRYADIPDRALRQTIEPRAEPGGHLSPDLRWLAANREAFAGQWVALQEGRLLASASDAHEVFHKVKYISPPPVVIRVDAESLPFAGW